MFVGIPTPARNFAFVVAISVIAVLVVGFGLLYALLIYNERQIPRELILVLSGVGTLLAQLSILFVGRQAKTNSEGTREVVNRLDNGISNRLKSTEDKTDENNELLQVIKGAIEDGHRNMSFVSERFQAIESRLIDRTSRFDRIEEKLERIAKGVEKNAGAE